MSEQVFGVSRRVGWWRRNLVEIVAGVCLVAAVMLDVPERNAAAAVAIGTLIIRWLWPAPSARHRDRR